MKSKILILCLSLFILIPCLFSYSVEGSAGKSAFIDDTEALLSRNSLTELEDKMLLMAKNYDIDFVVVTSADFDGMDSQSFADDYYDYSQDLSGDGIILVISDSLGEVFISTSGKAIKMISDETVDAIFDKILDDLSVGNYAVAIEKYLSECEIYCDRYLFAKENEPFLSAKQIALCVVIGIIIGLIGVSSMKSEMKTVRAKTSAHDYVVSGSLDLTEKYDVFLYRNVTRVRRQSQSSGGNRTGSSGRSHGGSGRSF